MNTEVQNSSLTGSLGRVQSVRESPSVNKNVMVRNVQAQEQRAPSLPATPQAGVKNKELDCLFLLQAPRAKFSSAALLFILFSTTCWHHPQAGAKMAAVFQPSQPDPDPEKQTTMSWVNFPSSLFSSVIGQHRPLLNQSRAKGRGLPGRLGPVRTCPLGLGKNP